MKKTLDGIYCVSCGKPIDKDSSFCPYCGTEVARKSKKDRSKLFKRISLFFAKVGKIEHLFIKIVLVVIAIALWTIVSELEDIQHYLSGIERDIDWVIQLLRLRL